MTSAYISSKNDSCPIWGQNLLKKKDTHCGSPAAEAAHCGSGASSRGVALEENSADRVLFGSDGAAVGPDFSSTGMAGSGRGQALEGRHGIEPLYRAGHPPRFAGWCTPKRAAIHASGLGSAGDERLDSTSRSCWPSPSTQRAAHGANAVNRVPIRIVWNFTPVRPDRAIPTNNASTSRSLTGAESFGPSIASTEVCSPSAPSGKSAMLIGSLRKHPRPCFRGKRVVRKVVDDRDD